MAQFPVTDWLVEHVRVTGFSVSAIPDERRAWWAPVVGAEPEARTTKPRAGAVEEAGMFESPALAGRRARLLFSGAAWRLDWRLLPADFDLSSSTPDSVAVFPESSRAIVDLVQKWRGLSNVPDLKRIALGAVLHRSIPSVREGYAQLADFLPAVTIDPAGSRDFFYQINRPRPTTVLEGLEINRLSKWSDGAIQLLSLASPTPSGIASSTQSIRLELDINTPAERKEALPNELVIPVLEHLRELALEIATEGDLP